MNNSDALPFIGHLAYVACHQIAAALLEGANLPDGVDAGEHVALGLRAVRPSGRDFDWEHRWPWPGQWSDRTDGGDIVHTGWRAMGAAADLQPIRIVQVVAYRPEDVLGESCRGILAAQTATIQHVDIHEFLFWRFAGADLRGVNLSGAVLAEEDSVADLTGVNLMGGSLMGAHIPGARFDGATLALANLKSARLECSRFRGADMRSIRAHGADFGGADLSGAALSGAKLVRANLRGANLSGANLDGANLDGANLHAAKWDALTVWPEGFAPAE